jgi:hypothetical protein
MSRRNQIIVLVVLLAILAIVLYRNWGGPTALPVASAGDVKYQPLAVENPSLRLDMLERIRKFEYTGRHRNIFSASLPPPPPPKVDPTKQAQSGPPAPAPLEVPVKFFGYAADPQTGYRRAFFTNGEDVFIVAEGETLLSRFRLLHIGNSTADLEEIASGRRATLVLEESGPPPA